MMEEAAGTRMYESKKASAVKTIAKKDSKLQEIEKVRIFSAVLVAIEIVLTPADFG